MKCMYCGQDNPDGAVFCVCGRPLTLGGGYGNPFPVQTPDMVPHRKAVPKLPLILLILAVLGVCGFIGYHLYLEKSMTDESKWKTIDGKGYSITVPIALKEGKMLTVNDSDGELLGFYTSEEAGFDVHRYNYTDVEKKMYGGLDAQAYLDAFMANGRRKISINGQELKYQVREGEDYFYAGCNRHCINHIGKTDEVYYIDAVFPTKNGFYVVDVYCAEDEKDKYEAVLLKWLDSFEPA
ncbi:MAG: zinc ribbon domain-containing protein [Ruminococcus sp.]|nr:zinc ribbon domain-containing protein [Ruminococcus sp.]